jgi:alpha-glucosidase
MDSNGDGIGDLQGIIDRLDYLVELGIDAVWISPIFASPMVDFGYDVSDYTDIHPMFGDMETFDRLLKEAHDRNLRVVLDYVPNHSSDQHPWFIESRSSRDNARRQWYIWRDPGPDGGPPNNWVALPGGSAWERDERTQQYYLHLFLKEQPDLNWRNPEVVEAMHSVLRFWLDRGVDGFRMDMAAFLIKHPDFPDNPPIREDSPLRVFGLIQELAYNMDQPKLHGIFRRFRSILDSYPGGRAMIGEMALFDLSRLVAYYGENLDEFHIPFNFITLFQPWDAQTMRGAIEAYYAAMPAGATPNFVFGNHDFPRLATRFGPENHRSAGMLLLTLWGIPTMYYGDELGMENVPVPPERRQDPLGIGHPELDIGRDPVRTPMQWDASPSAGFAPEGAKTWLPVADNHREVNVAAQREDRQSTLHFYQKLLKLRRTLPALHGGDFAFVEEVPPSIIAYTRCRESERLLVVINFGGDLCILDLSSLATSAGLLVSSQFSPSGSVDLAALPVKPHESLLLRLNSDH